MQQNDMKYEKLIRAFHQTWDKFPGIARLIDKNNYVFAVNKAAEAAGFEAGQICAKMGAPESHRGCKKALALSLQTAQMDRPTKDKIRTWLPLDGYPDLVIHFSILMPEQNQNGEKA